MCRLLGISYGTKREELDTAEIAAIMFPALVRQGPHAFGWMTQHEDYGIEYRKFPGRCDTEEAWTRIIEEVDATANWFVGHTRWATHGDPKNTNNDHPIPHDNIVGVHNGVIRNHVEIFSGIERWLPDTQVDSEAIFAAVNRWGPQKGLRKLKGDMVAIWGDLRRQDRLFIARTAGRQLTFGWTARGNLIFASERQALERLCPEIEFVRFSTIAENKLLVIRNGEIIKRTQFAPVHRKIFTPGLQSPSTIGRPVSRPPGQSVAITPQGAIRVRSIVEHFDNDQEDAAALAAMRAATQQALAKRRGEKLFPHKNTTTKQDPKVQEVMEARGPHTEHAREWLEHASNGTLVEWHGALVTPAEYEWLTGESLS